MFKKKTKVSELAKAELEFLIKFKNGFDLAEIRQEDWNQVLPNKIPLELSELINDGLIHDANLNQKISYSCTIAVIKELLSKNGQKVGGNKAELVERASAFINDPLIKKIQKRMIFVLTEIGNKKLIEYLEIKKIERDEAENKVMQYLESKDYYSASKTMTEYEAKQVFQRGMGINWNKHDPKTDVAPLKAMFSEPSKLLKGIPKNSLKYIQIAGAMMYLWGTGDGLKWLPDELKTECNGTAARMVCFRGYSTRNIEGYKEGNVVKEVQILSRDDSCDECKKMAEKTYTLLNAPELPHENCTHPTGCRCTYIPVLYENHNPLKELSKKSR